MVRTRKTPGEKALTAALRALVDADPELAEAQQAYEATFTPFKTEWLNRPRTPQEEAANKAHHEAGTKLAAETARALRALRMDLDQRIRTEEQRASKEYDPGWGKGVAQGAA